MEGSLIEYEQTNNLLLSTLKNNKESFRTTVKSVLESENAFLLVPTSISLEGIEISTAFIETHTIICPENRGCWISLNGLSGLISSNRELLHIIGTPIVDKSVLGPLFDITAFYRENRSHFLSIFESFVPTNDTPSRPILREWKVVIGDIMVPIILIGEPITYEGCIWTKTSPKSQGDLLLPDIVAPKASVIPSNETSRHRRITSNSNAQINSMLTLLDLPSTMQEKPPLFPPQEDTLSPIPMAGILSSVSSACNSTNNSPTNSPPGSPGRSGSRILFRNSSLNNVKAIAPVPTTPMTPAPASPTSMSSAFSFASKIPFFPIAKSSSVPIKPLIKQQPMSIERVVPETSQKSYFFQMMSRPEAKMLASRIKMFVEDFEKRPGAISTHEDRIKQFLSEMESHIYSHPLWKGASEQALESTSEGLEKYVLAKLYPKLFMNDEDCIKRDRLLKERIRRLSFVVPEHLDVKVKIRQESIATACSELNKIAHYKSPKDKLICIMNCCKVIYSQILTTGVAGADEFLPILIFIVLKANPPNLWSNIKFISAFRNPSKLSITELGYYFTQLESGVSFIETLDSSRLSIDPAEFERLLSLTEQTIEHPVTAPLSENLRSYSDDNIIDDSLAGRIQNPASGLPDGYHLPPSTNITNYKFLNKTVKDLTIGEVGELLEEYKTLANELELLKKHMALERAK